MSAAGPPQGANAPPWGAAQRPNWPMRPQAWRYTDERRRAAPRRECAPLGGSAAAELANEAASVGVHR